MQQYTHPLRIIAVLAFVLFTLITLRQPSVAGEPPAVPPVYLPVITGLEDDITPTPADFTQITGGDDHTCALTDAGGVKCWGWNASGQLGDGSNDNRLIMVNVVGMQQGIAAISARGDHTCALTTSGAVKCWGYNQYGQIGNGESGAENSPNVPANVVGLSGGVKAISAGNNFTCALKTAGTVHCWGANGFGQLGNNSTTGSAIPVTLSALSGIQAISLGNFHACALTTSGGVKCWGLNMNGQLGDNSTTDRHVPVDVSGLTSGVRAIAAGGQHTCALLVAGGVKCWGSNASGRLGDNTTTNRLTPVSVTGLPGDIAAITAAGGHTCALTTAGGAKCWGFNLYGQIGDGTAGASFDRHTPVNVTGLGSGVESISAASFHTCAIMTTGAPKCWGQNELGKLGDGTTAQRATPTDVIVP